MALILSYIVKNDDIGKTLGNFLKEQQLSKKGVIALKHRGGEIVVDGVIRTTRYVIASGEQVTVKFGPEPVSRSLNPVEIKIDIVYEDDYLLIVDKEAGMPVIPTGSHENSLANGVRAYYEKIGLPSTIHFVNRLDKDTSGLLVIAKYRHIHHLLTQDIKQITRKYYARIEGHLKKSCLIDAPIYRPDPTSVKRIVSPLGQFASTSCEIVQYEGDDTLVSCELATGRTHQIRVHMQHIGHSIKNDPLYGSGDEFDQQLLHSYLVELVHPITRKNLRFETEVPARFNVIA